MRGLWSFLIFVFLLFVGLAIAVVMGWGKFGTSGLLIGFGCYVLAWIVAEIATGVIFYTYGTFSVRVSRPEA